MVDCQSECLKNKGQWQVHGIQFFNTIVLVKRQFCTIAISWFVVSLVIGQDSLLLTKNFRFKDGVYFSFDQLRSNQPAFALDSLKVQYFTNPQTSLTQLDGIFHKVDKGKAFPVDSIWAICLDGVPSLRVPQREINKLLPNFAALKLRGKICYFTYPDYRTKSIRVAAYNPLTGRPFRQGTVKREQEVIIEKILNFQTGEIAEFNEQHLNAWIQDDPLLLETLHEIPPAERQEKLFKCLLIYVDRNPVYLMMNDE